MEDIVKYGITDYLTIEEILNLCKTNKEYKKLCSDNNYWQYLIQREYNISYKKDDAFDKFKEIYTIMRNKKYEEDYWLIQKEPIPQSKREIKYIPFKIDKTIYGKEIKSKYSDEYKNKVKNYMINKLNILLHGIDESKLNPLVLKYIKNNDKNFFEYLLEEISKNELISEYSPNPSIYSLIKENNFETYVLDFLTLKATEYMLKDIDYRENLLDIFNIPSSEVDNFVYFIIKNVRNPLIFLDDLLNNPDKYTDYLDEIYTIFSEES